MIVSTLALSGNALNWAVVLVRSMILTGGKVVLARDLANRALSNGICDYATSWADAGPLLELYEISTKRRAPAMKFEEWEASGSPLARGVGFSHATGPTPLVAAMRLFVAAHAGNEIDIPEELAA